MDDLLKVFSTKTESGESGASATEQPPPRVEHTYIKLGMLAALKSVVQSMDKFKRGLETTVKDMQEAIVPPTE